MSAAKTVVYTDGACSGNPGPGGWAWAVPGGEWARGHDPDTTNQRMELMAALAAVQMLDGELDIVSDSTYFVNCFKDGWWKGWEKRGWKNSKKEPVANRDLWEPLIEAHKQGRFGVPRWVKGHSGDPMNDLVDRLAVASSHGGDDARGDVPPTADELGPADEPRGRGAGSGSGASGSGGAARAKLAEMDPAVRREERRRRDGRIPGGTLLVTGGVRDLGFDAGSKEGRDLRRRLAALFDGYAQMHDDLQVLTGLRPGAEALAAEAAIDAGVDWVAVLPWPDPQNQTRVADRERFLELRAVAPAEVVLERKVPEDVPGMRKALNRRDAWLSGAADLAVVVWDYSDDLAKEFVVRFEKSIPDDVLIVPPTP